MIHYSINDLERYSGIKAHTIRIWEKRYRLFIPKRHSSNIRYYDNEQLRKLLNIATLINHGIKISKVSSLSEMEVNKHIKEFAAHPQSTEAQFEIYVNELLSAAIEFNKQAFDSMFNSCVVRFGFSQTIDRILYPLLTRTGTLWCTADVHPAQEHFISNPTKQKLFSAIDGKSGGEKKANRKYLLFLPESEEHEIGLLYTYYLLLREGESAIYLGQRVPFESLIDAVKTIKPTHVVFFSVTHQRLNELQKYLIKMSKSFPNQKIFVAGNMSQLNKLKSNKNVSVLRSKADINLHLSSFSL